jgi:glucose-6-phosphate 1-dehydrogenase
LYDALCGNRVLFPLSEEVNLAWQLVDEIRAYFNKDIIPLRFYPSGSWGPAESDKLINRFKFNWERL